MELPTYITKISDLMDLDGRPWNLGGISNIFPNEIKEMIIKTPILELEQDSLM